MRSLRKLLGLDPEVSEVRDTETVRRIADELDRLEHEEARYLAAFAYVLARVAHADTEVTPEEIATMETLVRERSQLSPSQSALVVQIARSQAVRFGGTEDYLVTRQFRDISSQEQRVGLLRCLFAVAVADESISDVENTRISQIATELGISARDVAAIRGEHRDRLAVLRFKSGPAG